MPYPAETTIDVAIPVEPTIAALLRRDEACRQRTGRLVSLLLRREAGLDRLFAAMDALAAEAERRGAAPSEGAGLAAEFRAFRRGQRLDGLKPKDLIAEGQAGETPDGT